MKVTIRKKKIANGSKYSIMLDYYANGLRKFETLGIHLYAKPKTEAERKHNADKKIIMEEIRRKRENESQTADFNIEQVLTKKGNFLEYYQTYIDKYAKKDIRMVKNSQRHFKNFIEKKHPRRSITGELYVRPADVKKDLCIEFKDYLSDECGLSGETPANFFARFRKVLKKAVDDGIFLKNPAEGIINRIDKNTVKKDVLTIDEIKLLYKTPASLLLGHTNLENTIKYVRKAEQLENEAIDKLPSFV